MNPDRWSRIQELFHSASEREPSERAAFLASACADDAALRSEVEALLAADEVAGSFLGHGIARAAVDLLPDQSVGPYRILGLIGRGGMGEVYHAQDTRLAREVAIKVLPHSERWARPPDPLKRVAPEPVSATTKLQRDGLAGAVGEQDNLAFRRFEREALLTANVQHPAVVPIYARGELPDGRPFYAMKLVTGRSLREMIDERKTLAERMALLPNVIAVAEALAHAHWKRVIHRDVKPSNIVVGEFGETLLIDWGLAKNLSQPTEESLAASTLGSSDRTTIGDIIGTPSYMSPEQANGLSLDEHADVFSLGATLYHVLTGRAPYEGETASILPSVAKGDYAAVTEVQSGVPPELAAIVSKAMAREPEQRYPTARELAEDLRRFQTGQLVLSHRYSSGELLRRWAKRNRTLLLSSAAFLAVALLGGAIGLRKIVVERDRANREAEASQRVSQFMIEMFKVSDPGEARGNNVTARELLEKASDQIASGLAKDPEIQGRLMDTMALAYRGLGLYAKARSLAEKSVEVRQKVLGPEHPDTLRSMTNLANVEVLLGDQRLAEKMYQQVLDIQRRVLGAEHPDSLRTMHNLAVVAHRLGRYTEAEKLYRKLVEIDRRVIGPEHRQTLTTITNLAIVLEDQGQYAAAEKLYQEVLDSWRRQEDEPDATWALLGLAGNKVALGQYAEAEKLYGEGLAFDRRTAGPEHPTTLRAMQGLGEVYLAQKRIPEAHGILQQALEISRRVLGPEHLNTLDRIQLLAQAKTAQGEYAEAERMLSETLAIDRRVLGPNNPRTLGVARSLADVEAHQGRNRESEALQLETLSTARRVLGPRHPLVGRILYNLGSLALRQGNRNQALDLLRQSVQQGLSPSDLIQMREDDDLKELRGDPAFESLFAKR